MLLVEDHAGVQMVFREYLKLSGYQVLEASNGAEALQLAEGYEGPIHLMLTDVVMPEMSGRELAARLAPLRPEMKVLYTSGYTDSAIVHHGVLDPDKVFLQKPLTLDALAQRCARCWAQEGNSYVSLLEGRRPALHRVRTDLFPDEVRISRFNTDTFTGNKGLSGSADYLISMWQSLLILVFLLLGPVDTRAGGIELVENSTKREFDRQNGYRPLPAGPSPDGKPQTPDRGQVQSPVAFAFEGRDPSSSASMHSGWLWSSAPT